MSAVDLGQGQRFLTILDEAADVFCFRTISKRKRARNYTGTFEELAPALQLANLAGDGVYAVVNEGGHERETIKRVRAVFADLDGAPLEPVNSCGMEPHMIIETSPGKWHAYWLVDGLPLDEFTRVQHAIAAAFASDEKICDLPRIMRVPGFNHTKGDPYPVRIIHESGAVPYTAQAVLQKFPPSTAANAVPTAAPVVSGAIAETERNTTLTSLAGSMRRRGMEEGEIEAALHAVNTNRCSPPLDAADVSTIARSVSRYEPAAQQVAPAPEVAASRVEAMASALAPFTAADYALASKPHPHAFDGGDDGVLFPVSEVTVLAAQGREGKTYCIVSIASAYARGECVSGLAPVGGGRVVIYSAEDDPIQYARKVLALGELHGQGEWRDRLIVPNLEADGIAEWCQLVRMVERRAVRGEAVDALIEAMRPMMASAAPPGIVVFETASTLTEADEDNAGQKALILAVRKVARAHRVACVLVHHTSQQAASNLPTLNVSVADIRGATALVFNARQCLMLANLGSEEDPFPDTDARTMLRRMVAPGWAGRVTVLIPLDTSKGVDPAPIFMRWQATPYGPALVEIRPPADVAGKKWRRVLAMLRGQRAELQAEAKDSALQAKLEQVVAAVVALDGTRPASARAVSEAAGHAPGWADRYLRAAVEAGLLVEDTAKIPNTKGTTTVYRLPDLSDKAA